MAYMSSSAALPQNSLDPLPAAEVETSNARILAAFWQSRTGRERLYANLPAADSFYDQWPGLAVDAARVIAESETARQSILNGLTYTDQFGASDNVSAGPEIVSLNAGSSQDMTTSGASVIPNSAPVQLPNGLWFSEKPKGFGSSHPVTTSKRQNSGISLSKQGVSETGPGCPALPPARRAAEPVYPVPPPAPNPPAPSPIRGGVVHYYPKPMPNYPDTVIVPDDPIGAGQFMNLAYAEAFFGSQGYRVLPMAGMTGLGAIAPTWGQVGALDETVSGSGSGSRVTWPWIVGGVVLLGVLVSSRKRGRRG